MWWYAHAGQRIGPVNTEALKAHFQREVITADSLVWKEGFAEWRPLRDVDELQPLLRSIPPPLPAPVPAPPATLASNTDSTDDEPAAAPAGGAPAAEPPHYALDAPGFDRAPLAGRWPRFLARLFDVWWESLAVVALALVAVLAWVASGGTLPQWSLPPAAYGLMALPVAFLLDALVYGVFSNTPGKALLGLSVTDGKGERLRIGQYLDRNLRVWAAGWGLGIPIVSLFALLRQAQHVKNSGTASYDEAKDYRVHRTAAGIARTAAFAALSACLLVVLGIFTAVSSSRALVPAGSSTRAAPDGPDAPGAATNTAVTGAHSSTSPAAASRCDALFVGGLAPTIFRTKLDVRTTYLCMHGVALMYSGLTRTPLWSAEHVTAADLAAAPGEEAARLHIADQLPALDGTDADDFYASGYRAEPLTPPADMATPMGRYDANSYANAAPMREGPVLDWWRKIGASIRRQASLRGELYVVSGALFEGAELQSLGGRVLVPTAYYKAVYDPSTAIGAAYIVDSTQEAHDSVTSLADLEARAGVILFPGLPDTVKRMATPSEPAGGAPRAQ